VRSDTLTFFGFLCAQDRATVKLLDSIERMLPAAAVVIRNGERRSVDPATLVPGDLVAGAYTRSLFNSP
jgi:magnesium-transporting ATPase (P-type)